MALNLAVHLGARRIILVGYDMWFPDGKDHWHDDHEVPSKEVLYKKTFARQYPIVKKELDRRKIRVFNASLISRIDCWPKLSLNEALEVCHELKLKEKALK